MDFKNCIMFFNCKAMMDAKSIISKNFTIALILLNIFWCFFNTSVVSIVYIFSCNKQGL